MTIIPIILLIFSLNMLIGIIVLSLIDTNLKILEWTISCPLGSTNGMLIVTTFWFVMFYLWFKNKKENKL